MNAKFLIHKYLPIIVFLLGTFLRVIYLGDVPGGYHRDEAYSAWNALSLYKDGIDSTGHSYPVYFEAWAHGQNALNSYLMLPFLFLNGGHINSLIIRIPQVSVALLTLISVYKIMNRMFSRHTACLSLFLLAICPWHIMMSRWGLESNLAPGLLILGFCFWIYGMDRPQFFLLSGLFYGLSLYSYATIWPIVPVMIALQAIYGFSTHKIRFDKWLVLFGCILFSLALPLLLFLLVNMDILPEFKIGCFSVYKMTLFRSDELAHSLSDIWKNIRNVLYLLWHQDVGRPYDVIMPYGFFYNIGRVFSLIGVLVTIVQTVSSVIRRKFTYLFFITVQLLGAGIVGCLITVNMTQINCLYIPLVLCQAIGITYVINLFSRYLQRYCKETTSQVTKNCLLLLILGIYMINLFQFQREYYTDYKTLASAHFQEGADEAVRFAQNLGSKRSFSVYVNSGLKYPNVLLATATGAQEYRDTLVYSDSMPAPKQFDCSGVTFYMGIDYENISKDNIYVLYFTDLILFEDYDLTQFHDWFVAVPK